MAAPDFPLVQTGFRFDTGVTANAFRLHDRQDVFLEGQFTFRRVRRQDSRHFMRVSQYEADDDQWHGSYSHPSPLEYVLESTVTGGGREREQAKSTSAAAGLASVEVYPIFMRRRYFI